MQARRNGDTDALHLPEEFPIIRKRCHAQLIRDRLRPPFVDIHHRYQSRFWRICILFRMEFSQVAHTHNSCGDF